VDMNVKENRDITIIELSGKVDAQISPEIRSKIKALIGEGKNKLVVDLDKVSYMDSGVLGVLLSGMRSTREENGDLKLAAIQAQLQEIFRLTELNKVFKIFENQEDAVVAFQNESTC